MNVLLQRVKNVANDRITRVLFYDQTPKKGYASLTVFSKTLIMRRVLLIVAAFPLSLLCWIFLVLLNLFTSVRIYRFQRPQRPGFASVYIEQLEPLCRELQANINKGFLVFIDASETTNVKLLELYASHFSLYLDDRRKFARTIFFLVPKLGFVNLFVRHDRFDTNWELPPAKNLKAKVPSQIPNTISKLGLRPMNYVLFAYPSRKYYANKKSEVAQASNRFVDPSTCVDAFKILTLNGLKIVRVAQDPDDLTPSLKDLPIIDLSGNFRSDVQDLWLFENCLFSWSIGPIGTWHFAHKFDRPTLITDSDIPINGYQSSLYMLRTVHSTRLNRNLTIDELFQLKGVLGRIQEMWSQELSYIQNTPQQLCNAIEEMVAFSKGHEPPPSLSSDLLKKYDQILVNLGFPERKTSHTKPCISMLREQFGF
jgi:putative glycosyltransferase (TIGR04372 family)